MRWRSVPAATDRIFRSFNFYIYIYQRVTGLEIDFFASYIEGVAGHQLAAHIAIARPLWRASSSMSLLQEDMR
jgi:hypothetical protein